ncbi:MAG: methionyl-tRNA formyltransferase [Kiritimatiellia bacterium]
MNIQKIIYFGTAPIAVPALKALRAQSDSEVVAVCTQPDRPGGRKRRLMPSPVKQAACELGLPVLDPEKIGAAKEALAALEPDLAVVFAYGQYLPRSIFDLPVYGSINFHPSLLPKYRGASPIQTAILDGCSESGLSVIRLGETMDAGDLLFQQKVSIGPGDTSEDLTLRFANLAADLVPELLRGLREETLTFTPQNEEEVTECRKIAKADGVIDWTKPASVLHCQIRAFQPWPGAFFGLGELGSVKVLEAGVESGDAEPGTLLETAGEGPLVACGEQALRLTVLQPPGKKPMDGRSFLNGHPLQVGTVLESAL